MYKHRFRVLNFVLLCSATLGSFGQMGVGTLAWWAAQARSRGQSHIDILSKMGDSEDEGTLHEVLRTRTLLTAVPISSSVVTSNNTITTWYRLRILSTLSKPAVEPACVSPGEIPQSDPLRPDELGLAIEGGTAHVDGIDVTIKSSVSPELTLGKSYLFVADVCPNNLASLSLGNSSVYDISPDRRILSTTSSNRPAAKEIESQHTLAKLHSYLQESSRRQSK